MKHLSGLIFSCLVLAAGNLDGDETFNVKFRVVSDHSYSGDTWVGVFVGPVHPDTEALSWTSFDSNEFTLEIPESEEELLLVALRRDFVPITRPITSEQRNSEIPLDFKSGQFFQGTVVSTDGIEVPDAVLSVVRRDVPWLHTQSQARFEWTSDREGSFSIGGLVEGKYEIHVALPHIPEESSTIQLSRGKDLRRDFVLKDAYFVRGRVVDHAESEVEGAEVRASFNVHFLDSREALNIPSDSLGEFQMGPFVNGQTLNLSATHKDGGSTHSNRVFSGNHEVKLILSRLVGVVGMVQDAATGAPLNEFTLKAHGGMVRDFAHSDTNGRISAVIDSRAWALVIEAPNYAPYFDTDLDLDSIDEYDMGIVEMDPGIHLTGVVYDSANRQPIEGALIASWGQGFGGGLPTGRTTFIVRYMQQAVNATSDAEGKYSMGPLPSDKAVLRVSARGYKWKEVTVDGQTTQLNIDLTALDVQTTKIVGKIQTTNGESVSGWVNVYHVENNSGAGFRSEEDGSFEFSTRAGSHSIHATSDSGRSETLEFTLVDGDVREIVLVVDPSGRLVGSVSGLLSAEEAFVSVLSGNRAVGGTGSISNEEFSIQGLGTGSFTVRASTTMNRQLTRTIQLSEDSDEAFVEFSFDGNSRLYGKVQELEDPTPYLQVRAFGKQKGSMAGWSYILDDGSFEIRGLSDGEYWIKISEERGFGISKSDAVSRGERFDVVVVGDTELNIDLAQP